MKVILFWSFIPRKVITSQSFLSLFGYGQLLPKKIKDCAFIVGPSWYFPLTPALCFSCSHECVSEVEIIIKQVFPGCVGHAPPSPEGEAFVTFNHLEELDSFSAAAPFLNSHTRRGGILKGQRSSLRSLPCSGLFASCAFLSGQAATVTTLEPDEGPLPPGWGVWWQSCRRPGPLS